MTPRQAATLNDAIRLQGQNRWEQALALALPLAEELPGDAAVQNLAAVLLAQAGRLAAAIARWECALAVAPEQAALWSNLGRAAWTLGRKPYAEACFRRVVALTPNDPQSWLNIGAIHQSEGRDAEALASYGRVLQLDPNHVPALFNCAVIHAQASRLQTAHALYHRVLSLDPSHLLAQSHLIFSQHYLDQFDPSTVAALSRRLGQQYASEVPHYRSWRVDPSPERALRIGLLSADLRDHPVGYFIEGLLQHSSTAPVQWFAYANQSHNTALTARIAPIFAQWLDVRHVSDAQLAERIRTDRVDILIDLSGMTDGHRLGVLARQPAPLQLSWLGYFATTGLPTMQGVIADPISVPEAEAGWFTEPVYRLPVTRFCFTSPENAPPIAALPALHNGFVTFGCYQAVEKIHDHMLAVWGDIARKVPGARWRIQCTRADEASRADLLRRLQAAGIEADRVRVLPAMPRQAYLASYAEVDVVLDTWPYPGGTTTAEALWMGVPTLTLPTPGMLGRQGQQMLTAAGLSDWVATDERDYVDRAVALAQPEAWAALAPLREGLRHRVSSSPLFDNVGFARDWHDLVRDIWGQRCAIGWPTMPA